MYEVVKNESKIISSISMSNMASFINSSNSSQGHCANFTKEDDHVARNITISSAVMCSLIFLFGTTTSGYVIWMKVYNLEKTFRSVLSIHLLISGFIWSLFLFFNVVYFACGENWPFGTFMCRLNNLMFHLNMFMSAFIFLLYSIDYYLVVVYPFRYVYYRRPFLASLETRLSWIAAFCFSIPYFFFKTTHDCHGAIQCLDRSDDTATTDRWERGHKVIEMMAFVLGYCIPLFIIILCLVIAALVYHRKKTSEYSPALKRIFTLQTFFGVCWLPYHVFFLMKLSLPKSEEKHLDGVADMVQPITISLASLGGFVYPILFIFMSPGLK